MSDARKRMFQLAASAFAECPCVDNFARMQRALELYAVGDAAVDHAQCTHRECRFQNVAQRKTVTIFLQQDDPGVPACPQCWKPLAGGAFVKTDQACPSCGIHLVFDKVPS